MNKTPTYLGIDLGKSGFFCFLEGIDDYEFIPIPLKKTKSGKQELCDIQATEILKDYEILHCVFENISLNPLFANHQAIKNLAEMQGFFTGACRMGGIPFTCCGAKAWQNKSFDIIKTGSTKKRSIEASKKINPNVELRRNDKCRVDNHDMSDAYLMALYAKRLHGEADAYLNLYRPSVSKEM